MGLKDPADIRLAPMGLKDPADIRLASMGLKDLGASRPTIWY